MNMKKITAIANRQLRFDRGNYDKAIYSLTQAGANLGSLGMSTSALELHFAAIKLRILQLRYK